MNLEKDIEDLEKKIAHNANKIESNEQRIHQNTSALEILKAFKAESQMFFVIWLVTFIAFLISIGFIILK